MAGWVLAGSWVYSTPCGWIGDILMTGDVDHKIINKRDYNSTQ